MRPIAVRAVLLLMMSVLALAAFSLPAAAACHQESSHDCCPAEEGCDADCADSQHGDDGCRGPGCDGCFLPCCSGLVCLLAAGAELAPGDDSHCDLPDYASGFTASSPDGIDRPPRS